MSDAAALAESLHPHEATVLRAFPADHAEAALEQTLVENSGLETAQVGAALGRLHLKNLVGFEEQTEPRIVSLTATGTAYLENLRLSPLSHVLATLRDATHSGHSLTMRDLQVKLGLDPGEISGVIGDLKQEQVITIAPGGVVKWTGMASSAEQSLKRLLAQMQDRPTPLADLSQTDQTMIHKFSQKRGKSNLPFRLDDRVIRTYGLTEIGKTVVHQIRKDGAREEVARLTPDMLKDGSWRHTRFRKYTIGLNPARIPVGKKHPYREFLDGVKTKLVGMGFAEMRGGLVENEFWNMDALFMPQFHPARDTHDVYFAKDPSRSAPIREPFLTQVAQAHEGGGKTGSSGWRYPFDRMRTRRLVLRSQGTAVSARTLAAAPNVPGKYFSMARCFRYDQVDATHAPDFFQVEGLVLGPDITFRTLLGLLTLFAREMAQAQDIRFTPAYFPFTEPSVELHVRHPRLGWIELGGAGLFRPEVTRPLGLDVPVIAWGLGLDRMAMIALDIHDIRDLFSSDLDLIRSKRVHY